MFTFHTLITYWLIFLKILLLVVTDKINKNSTLGKAEAAEDNVREAAWHRERRTKLDSGETNKQTSNLS